MERMKLYSGTRNASSWAMRAWLALREAGIDFDEEIVDIRRPQRFANLRAVAAFSPSATVPVLVVDGVAIFDSLAIMEYANEVGTQSLLPADPRQRAEARSFMAWQHAGLSRICARLSFESAFYPWKRAMSASESAEAGRLFQSLEDALERSAGPFLFGVLSLADLALVPALVRLLSHAVDLDPWPRTGDWSRRVLSRPPVREWMREAAAPPAIWFDDYLLPGETPDLHPARVVGMTGLKGLDDH